MNTNYPNGADVNPFAPWHQEEPESELINVNVTQTFSKTVEIEVDDYETIREHDEDGIYYWNDYSGCNLYDYVDEQHLTIKDILKGVQKLSKQYNELINSSITEITKEQKLFNHQLFILSESCKNWHEEEINVELN